MSIIVIYMIISFLLDGLISNYIGINIISPSIFRTIYSVITLVIIYGYFDNKKKYLLLLIILGMLFDIVYTNTFLLNIIIFLIIYLFLNWIDYLVPNNIFMVSLKAYISIIIYHTTSYIILLVNHYSSYSFNLLIKIILSSIIMTIIYTIISHYIIRWCYYLKNSRKIR